MTDKFSLRNGVKINRLIIVAVRSRNGRTGVRKPPYCQRDLWLDQLDRRILALHQEQGRAAAELTRGRANCEHLMTEAAEARQGAAETEEESR